MKDQAAAEDARGHAPCVRGQRTVRRRAQVSRITGAITSGHVSLAIAEKSNRPSCVWKKVVLN